MAAKRIMVVDDERDYTQILHRMLERSGYEIVEIWHSPDVFRRLMNESFDLVILDHAMLELQGDRICEMIRSEEKLKDLPLIVVTAYRNIQEDSFKALGAQEVVYKPVDREELLEKVERCL